MPLYHAYFQLLWRDLYKELLVAIPDSDKFVQVGSIAEAKALILAAIDQFAAKNPEVPKGARPAGEVPP